MKKLYDDKNCNFLCRMNQISYLNLCHFSYPLILVIDVPTCHFGRVHSLFALPFMGFRWRSVGLRNPTERCYLLVAIQKLVSRRSRHAFSRSVHSSLCTHNKQTCHYLIFHIFIFHLPCTHCTYTQ